MSKTPTAPHPASRIPRWTAPGTGAVTAVEAMARLSPELTARLRDIAVESAVTLDIVLLAAHLRVLAALTSQNGPVAGYVPSAGTPDMPLSVGGPDLVRGTWREFLGTVARTGPAPAHGHESVLDLSEPGGAGTADAALPLLVRIARHGDGMTLRARSRTDVMTDEHLHRIVGYHCRALELLAADPGAPVRTQSLLSAEEKRFQLDELAGEERPLDGRLFVERFEEQARLRPEDIAVSHRDRAWTYARLNEHANRIAHALLDRGLAAEDVVAVVLDRGPEWAAATLGVLKAGGCYLPVQPDFPAARIAAQLDMAGCRFVIGAGGGAPVPGEGVSPERTLDVTDHCAGPATGEPAVTGDPGVPIAPGQLAYIYFTSGSTGTPKGVMCEHAGLMNHLLMKVEDMELGAGVVVAQTSVPSLDISLWQLIAPLLTGGSARIVDTEVLLDVQHVLDEIVSARVQVAQVVPSYFDALVGFLEQNPRHLGSLRSVSVTGEELKPGPVRRWFACRPEIRLVNAYGATEVSDDTMHEILDRAPEREFVTLGRLRRNVRGYVLDENGEPAPLGSAGEIAFSGVCVGRGYVNDPGRTGEAFVPDPFRPGTRMYRTGDFGRWLPEGRIQFLGRRDQQVKIRGFRIESGEVEHRLLAMDEVGQAVVVTVDGDDRHKALAAFLTGSGDRPDGNSISRFLAGHLPDYMIPAYYHWLDALPLSENGKVDRRALTELAGTLGHADGPYTAPVTPTEQRLAMAWAEALNVPLQRIGRGDGFFALGGTSLAATWLVVRLGGLVSLGQVVAHPVLSELAAVLDAENAARTGGAGAPALLQPLSAPRPAGTDPEGILVCFPYAGGNAVNFLALARELGPRGVDVHGVELPGHDLATVPAEAADVADVARRVRDELQHLPDVPVLLWGHGEGAAYALALARLLEDGPVTLRRVLVGAPVPLEELGARRARAGAMSDREVTDALLREGAYVEFDSLKPERAGLLGAAYRHDVRAAGDFLLAARRRPAAHRITAGIDLIVAKDGTDGPAERCVGDWEPFSPEVRLRQLPEGGRYFTRTRASGVADAVMAALARPA
ncbi:amino acid adenylation domain-containing protein [Streptomyces sp. ET3-23]|uniref:non-ribosomal peptide synthetase n=1 Tax=Streptomyces sp. ET3-23 TaxID=2885643 RepID=UPI001D11A678|nr:amino acid adenylation domain-containing protein [Streptomyces sp. ET3-23]MCC2274678.1 amino acid adenylation domain-containing protein [Streptomyces sp. ET3-23]